MRDLWNKMLVTASDAGDLAEQVARSGIRFLRSQIGSLPLVTSTRADDSDAKLEADETHYLLVPYRGDGSGYTLYTTRSLPPGIGPSNSLPKRRIFHLHDEDGLAVLEKLLVESKKAQVLADRTDEKQLADHLEQLGEQIDKESFKVTGGLLIIGGAVAVVNPLVGAGIAAKALLPSLGAKASRLGLDLVGDKLRAHTKKREAQKAEKTAKSEIRKLKPEIYPNPLLRQLETAISTREPSHDPLLTGVDLVESFSELRYLRITAQAIVSIYEDALEQRQAPEELNLHAADLEWIAHLRDLGETLSEN